MNRSAHPPRLHRLHPLVAALIAALPLAAQAQTGGITDLGTLPGGNSSKATGVSADGTVVAGESRIAGGDKHAFRWTGGVMADLGTLGGTNSLAYGISANGAVVVGQSQTAGDAALHAFRWTGGVMSDLGTLGGTNSTAHGVSADGAVVVGQSQTAGDAATHAFRWTGGVMTDLLTLGGTNSAAYGVSADGAVVVGESRTAGGATHAFRWTGGVMSDLGTLGGTNSNATGVSADGAVVVGLSQIAGGASHAFRWTGGVMTDLLTLGGTNSLAYGISANGAVVVGQAQIVGGSYRAFRWTSGGGMQSVEDWLRASGVSVPADITFSANGTNSDGSVVVGQLANSSAFIARASSGLVTLADVQSSLAGSAQGGRMALTAADLVLNGAHSRPLARRVKAGQNTFWMAGDWGADNHGARDGNLGLAEVGIGRNFGPAQVNVALGQTWARQNLVLNGHAKTDGTYLLAEALIPVAGNLWATLGGYGHRGEADLKRGYLNAGVQDYSSARPDVNTWRLRGQLEWDTAYTVAGAGFSPYADLSYGEARQEGHTEAGGGFPARFDSRKEKATELRLGVNIVKPLDGGMNLIGTVEATHRFEKTGARTSGQVIGLFDFDLADQNNKQNWLRLGVGAEGKLAEGRASLSINMTTKGGAPNAWLAANWQKAF